MATTAQAPAPAAPKAPNRSAIDRFLTVIEKVGNALPHPATLFAILALAVVVLSEVALRFGLGATHPVAGEAVAPVSLPSIDCLHRILQQTVTNFTGFAPLGKVLVALIGIGICESSGLIGAVLRLVVLGGVAALPHRGAGVLRPDVERGERGGLRAAAAAGRGDLPGGGAPSGGRPGRRLRRGLRRLQRQPAVGHRRSAALRPVAGGGPHRAPRVHGEPGRQLPLHGGLDVPVTALGTFVAEKLVAPRFGVYRGEVAPLSLERLTPAEKRGLRFAALTAAVVTAIALWGLLRAAGCLRQTGTGSVIHSPFLGSVVTVIFLGGTLMGIAYGIGAGTVKSDNDVVRVMSQQMPALGGYLLLVFFAARFVAYFN